MLFGDNDNSLGDLGWGWRSIGRGIKKVGQTTYKVASLPAAAAIKVANATAKGLCAGGGPSGSGRDAQTASAFCKAMKDKDAVSARRLLPAATAYAAKKAKLETTASAVQKAYGVNGFGASSSAKRANYKACVAAQMSELEMSRSDAEYTCRSELEGLDDSEMNLLAAMDDVDPDSLAFALAGVDPTELGSTFTTSELLATLPMAAAVGAGLWLLLRG